MTEKIIYLLSSSKNNSSIVISRRQGELWNEEICYINKMEQAPVVMVINSGLYIISWNSTIIPSNLIFNVV